MLNRVKDAIIGAILSLLVVVLPYNYYMGSFEGTPIPYTVQEVKYDIVGSKLSIVAGFDIPDESCEFQTLDVFGYYLGEWFLVDWADPDGEQGDRVTGSHTLRINAYLDQEYEHIEIRTRHECVNDNPDTESVIETGTVGRVFAKIDLP